MSFEKIPDTDWLLACRSEIADAGVSTIVVNFRRYKRQLLANNVFQLAEQTNNKFFDSQTITDAATWVSFRLRDQIHVRCTLNCEVNQQSRGSYPCSVHRLHVYSFFVYYRQPIFELSIILRRMAEPLNCHSVTRALLMCEMDAIYSSQYIVINVKRYFWHFIICEMHVILNSGAVAQRVGELTLWRSYKHGLVQRYDSWNWMTDSREWISPDSCRRERNFSGTPLSNKLYLLHIRTIRHQQGLGID
jgi:hypothetical protein